MIDVLRKVKNGVETIAMQFDIMISDKLAEILANSHVQNVPYWHIHKCNEVDILYRVAEMWVDTNSKSGSTFQLSAYENGSFEKFLEHFDDRIVSKSEKRVRIRTNNPDRHILLERGLDDIITINYYLQLFRLMMISAEMKESEYNDNCKEWISKMDTDIYEEFDSECSYDGVDYDSDEYDY
ncbi:hypothetical protein B9Z55_012796 [Caenorhabditis nigoni]|nr:hypothetical protein B9Z55_012796 [Caenorhabditis nigoni]